MNKQAIENRIKINEIKNMLDLGCISYDNAKSLAKPIIDSINGKSKELAKKYGVKPRLVSFEGLMR